MGRGRVKGEGGRKDGKGEGEGGGRIGRGRGGGEGGACVITEYNIIYIYMYIQNTGMKNQ